MDFDDVKRVIGDTAQKAVKKSGEMVEYTKIKYAIYDLQNDINKIFTQIGQELYEGYTTGDMLTDDVKEKCEAIDAKKASIAELEEKLLELKSSKKCPQCDKSVSKETAFCPACGKEF